MHQSHAFCLPINFSGNKKNVDWLNSFKLFSFVSSVHSASDIHGCLSRTQTSFQPMPAMLTNRILCVRFEDIC